MTSLASKFIATFFCIFLTPLDAKPAVAPAEQVRLGFIAAQACEVEIDDDLTSYGECIGHAIDRITGQRFALIGLNFQAWLIADLAARQGGKRSVEFRQRYQQALVRGMRTNGWTVRQLCAAKQLACEPIELRLKQKF